MRKDKRCETKQKNTKVSLQKGPFYGRSHSWEHKEKCCFGVGEPTGREGLFTNTRVIHVAPASLTYICWTIHVGVFRFWRRRTNKRHGSWVTRKRKKKKTPRVDLPQLICGVWGVCFQLIFVSLVRNSPAFGNQVESWLYSHSSFHCCFFFFLRTSNSAEAKKSPIGKQRCRRNSALSFIKEGHPVFAHPSRYISWVHLDGCVWRVHVWAFLCLTIIITLTSYHC